MKSYIRFFLFVAVICGSLSVYSEVRIHDAEDSATAVHLLDKARSTGGDTGKRCVAVAEELIGVSAGISVENDSLATVKVCFHSFDMMDFVNSVLAVSRASEHGTGIFKEYADELLSVSRRRGEERGLVSKIIYGADWAVDNIFGGKVKELTEDFGKGLSKVKSLDYVTRHRDLYPALADSATYEDMRMMEMGFRSHRIPHIKKEFINKKEVVGALRDGDIIMMLSPQQDYDIYDFGFVVVRDDGPHLIHVSSESGKLVEETETLPKYFKREGQYFYGWRLFRPE